MKTIGTFLFGFTIGVGSMVLLANKIGKAERIKEDEDMLRFNKCECDHCDEEDEIDFTEEDEIIENYFIRSCECDAFGCEIEQERLSSDVRDMKVSVNILTSEGRTRLESILGFKLDDDSVLDEAAVDMLKMIILEQE